MKTEKEIKEILELKCHYCDSKEFKRIECDEWTDVIQMDLETGDIKPGRLEPQYEYEHSPSSVEWYCNQCGTIICGDDNMNEEIFEFYDNLPSELERKYRELKWGKLKR